jgi:RsmE family RNA methyltransferase
MVMRLHRFYIHKPLGEELVVESAGEEEDSSKLLHQWTRVFRYSSGDEVFLFSDTMPGKDFLYRITDASKDRVVLTPVSVSDNVLPEPAITLVMSLVKKDTFETVVRCATELGVHRIIPLLADRSEKKKLNFERLLSVAAEASEQSGRGTLPELLPVETMKGATKLTGSCLNIFGSIRGGSGADLPAEKGKPLAVWIGPEGGWTEEEEKALDASGYTAMKLGNTVLRADTAAVALLASVATAFRA